MEAFLSGVTIAFSGIGNVSLYKYDYVAETTTDEVTSSTSLNALTATSYKWKILHNHNFTYTQGTNTKEIIATCKNTDGNCTLPTDSSITVTVTDGKFTMPVYPVTVTAIFTANDYNSEKALQSKPTYRFSGTTINERQTDKSGSCRLFMNRVFAGKYDVIVSETIMSMKEN